MALMKVQVIQYCPTGVGIETFPSLENVKTRSDKSQLWLDVSEYDKAEELTPLVKAFGLHPLALDDCFNIRQRPKIDEYAENLFVIVRTVSNKDPIYSDGFQLGIFLGKKFVITVHSRPMPQLDQVLEDMKKGEPQLVAMPSSFLMYAILDNIVDNLEESVSKAEDMETEVGAEVLRDPPPENVLGLIYTSRRNLLLVRRLLRPQSDGVERLMSEDCRLVDQECRVFLRDVYDHTRRTLDRIDGLLDMNIGSLNIYLSSVSNKMNDVMRLLTVISTIGMLLTILVGWYGMNFHEMPEIYWTYGYTTVILIAATLTVGAILLFKRKGWL